MPVGQRTLLRAEVGWQPSSWCDARVIREVRKSNPGITLGPLRITQSNSEAARNWSPVPWTSRRKSSRSLEPLKTRNEKAGKLYQNFTVSLPEICFWPFTHLRGARKRGGDPGPGAEPDGALDLLSLMHKQFHFWETIQMGVGQMRSNLKYFYGVVFADVSN